MPDTVPMLTFSTQLETLQKKYDILLAETSPSPSRDRSNSRGKNQDEQKVNGVAKPLHPEAVYTITPGAPHSERVLPSTQRKQVQKPTMVEVEPRAEPHHNRSRSEQVTRGLGLYVNGSNSDWGGAEDSASTPTIGSIPNAPRRRLIAMNSVEDLSILSPPESSGYGHQQLHEVLSSSASPSAVDVSTPPVSTPSTLSWGTSIRSASMLSVGDMSLTGLPAFQSGSSLNLGVSGLPDFHHATEADEADEYGGDENMMTPSLRRQPDLAHEYDSDSDSGVVPRYVNPQRFESPPVAQNRRSSVSRQSAAVEVRAHDGHTPARPMGRSISDNISAIPASRSSAQGEDEMEVVALRFSQSFSDAEHALYGYGAASTPSSFEDPAPIRGGVRRATISTANARGLDLEGVEGARRQSASPVSVRPAFHRSVTFSTPKPDELPSKKYRDQGPRGPSTPGPRGTTSNQNTIFPIPYLENMKGHPISSRRGPSEDATRRGLATVATPLRDLPTFDPTYTAVGPSKRPLPSVHQFTPPPTNQSGRKEGQPKKQPTATRAAPPQPVNGPSVDVKIQELSRLGPIVSANVPIVAPQPVNPIRPWKWNGKTA